jgi:hypothetical protein
MPFASEGAWQVLENTGKSITIKGFNRDFYLYVFRYGHIIFVVVLSQCHALQSMDFAFNCFQPLDNS